MGDRVRGRGWRLGRRRWGGNWVGEKEVKEKIKQVGEKSIEKIIGQGERRIGVRGCLIIIKVLAKLIGPAPSSTA